MLAAAVCLTNGLRAFAADSPPSERPLVTFGDVLERERRLVRSVRWYGSEQLIVEFLGQDSGPESVRVISLKSGKVSPLEGGKFISPTPDAAASLQLSGSGWVMRNHDGDMLARIEEPPGEPRDFLPSAAPVWSADGRHAAIVEYHRPAGSDHSPTPTERFGVTVIELDETRRAAEQWVARITVVDRSEPAESRRIFIDDAVAGVAWGPDGTLFVSQTNFFGDETATVVSRIRPGMQAVEEVYRSPGRFQQMTPAVHPDGDVMALVLDVDNRVLSAFDSILLIDVRSGEELRRLTVDLPVLGNDYRWSPDGNALYARVRGGGLDQVYAFPLHGEPHPLTRGLRRHFDVELSPDGRRLSYRTEDGYGRKDVRVLDLYTREERIVLVLDEPAGEFRLGEWQHIRWESTDGVRPYGYLITPPGFDPDGEYPMIVHVHGGGPGSRLYLEGSLSRVVAPGPLEWHAWAALGYVVFVPDYRSTGDYGPAVIAARYEAGEMAAVKDIEDIVSGTRYMLDQGFVDPSRVAIIGHSAGGRRVYILLSRYHLYAAAVLNEAISPDPVSNFIGLATGKHAGGYPAGIYRRNYGGSLDAVPERYKTNYMFDSYGNSTPTLIMVGNEALGGMDHMPNEVLYSILNQHGTPARLLKFVDEGHTYSRAASAKVAFEEVRRWLETYMPQRD